MRLNNLLMCTLLSVVFMSGCWRPYHEKLFVDIGTSEVAILVETVNDNGQAVITPKNKDGDDTMKDFYRDRYVNARKIEIPYYWKQTGYYSTNGKWSPAARLIVVNTEVETREWTADKHTGSTDKNQGIWAESSDSVGFSTGISITANITDKDQALTFLGNYPPKSSREIITSGGEPFNVEVTSLEQIMDLEIRTKIQEVFAYEAASYTMDELREKKREIMDAIKESVIPYFEKKGITISTIGQFGGFTYENPEIQKSIDAVFQAQQDEEVARAETKAAEVRKEALKLTGEGKAAAVLEEKKGLAEGILAVANARAEELKMLQANPEMYLHLQMLEIARDGIQKWDGRLPTAIFGGGSTIVDAKKLME